MLKIANIPLRQKILISLTIIAGPILLFAYQFGFIDREKLNMYIWFYPIMITIWLLWGEVFIDLNNKTIFSIWVFMGIIYFIIYLFVHIPSFKTILIFLLVYRLLNFVKKQLTKDFLFNTFFAMSWKQDETKKPITWFDVLSNIILFITIIISSITK